MNHCESCLEFYDSYVNSMTHSTTEGGTFLVCNTCISSKHTMVNFDASVTQKRITKINRYKRRQRHYHLLKKKKQL